MTVDPKGIAPGLVEKPARPTVAMKCRIETCDSTEAYNLTIEPQGEHGAPSQRHYKCVQCGYETGVMTGGYFPYLASLLVRLSLAFIARGSPGA